MNYSRIPGIPRISRHVLLGTWFRKHNEQLLKQIITYIRNMRYTQHQGKPYAGIPQPPECSAGKDRTTNPRTIMQYCKDTGHELHVFDYKRKKLEAAQVASRTSNLLKSPFPGGHKRRGSQKTRSEAAPTRLNYSTLLQLLSNNLFWQNQNNKLSEGSFKLSFCNSTIVRDRKSLLNSGSMVTLIREGITSKRKHNGFSNNF